jgi:nicotinamide mononucleotide transporter
MFFQLIHTANRFIFASMEKLASLAEEYSIIIEFIGFLLNCIYLILIIRKKNSAWLWSIGACVIFGWICYLSQLYLQAILYLFYVVISLFGMLQWKRDTNNHTRTMSSRQHFQFILSCTIFGLSLGYLFQHKFNQNLPYLDGLITCFAIGTTLLIVSKQKANWIYWIGINLTSIYLYLSQQLYWLSFTSFVLLLFAIVGYREWSKEEVTNP